MRIENLHRGGAALRVIDTEVGLPVVFQHGLGGDAAQVAESFPDRAAYRRITLECRAQGASQAGEIRPFSIAMFADDVLAACNERGIERFVVGGISMGAAVALHIAAHNPQRVIGLILARPAWLFDPAPDNMRPYAEVAAALRVDAPQAARERFTQSITARALGEAAPDNLASLLRFFDRRDPRDTADLLADIAGDGPGVTVAQAAAISMPSLAIGHEHDFVHPLTVAQTLSRTIPGAWLATISSKAADKLRHQAELRATLDDFLIGLLP
jgi:pimeloyl-ACP methyl ester carboxylesterase